MAVDNLTSHGGTLVQAFTDAMVHYLSTGTIQQLSIAPPVCARFSYASATDCSTPALRFHRRTL
jgi:hypothetical protein